jgi:hypothetical protein
MRGFLPRDHSFSHYFFPHLPVGNPAALADSPIQGVYAIEAIERSVSNAVVSVKAGVVS